MTEFPEPQVGLVISYSYLWSEEAERGQIEGRKDRPCAIIVALEHAISETAHRKQVAVVPITHSPPRHLASSLEIPPRVKAHLGLDSERSWVILDDVNVFIWPGYDLRPIKSRGGRIDYGFLPPRLFDQLIEKFKALASQGKIDHTSRDE